MVENKIVGFKYFKFVGSGMIGLNLETINEKGETVSGPLISNDSYVPDDIRWYPISLGEFQDIARVGNLLTAPESPEPNLI